MSTRSMTGFARVRKLLPEGELIVNVKSVNHRGLDVHFRMPPEFDPFEQSVRGAIKERVARGHLQVQVVFNRNALDAGSFLNRSLMQAYVSAFDEARREFKLDGSLDLNEAFRVPGMLRVDSEAEVDEGVEKALVEAMQEALGLLNAFREREGAAMAAEMLQRCAAIGDMVVEMEGIRSRAVALFHKRLQERLKDLLKGAGLEPQRLAQEAALLADRSDVSEELLRLKTHAAQLERLLTGSGEVGKRLDFLLQEMNRESNTILSKTGGLGEQGLRITELALAAKSEIDKIREQSLNLE